LSVGCDDAEDSLIKKSGGAGAPATTGGTGGTTPISTGGSAGLATGGTGGASGSSGSGTGGTSNGAGTGGTGGEAAMAGAGGSNGGRSSIGGMGGDGSALAGSGTTAGMSAGGTGSSNMNPCAGGGTDGKTFAGHCYLLVTGATNFGKAKNDCMSKGGHLVTISNGDPESKDTFDAEDTFVYGLAGGKDTWLGLTDGKMDRDPGDGTFYKWITGEASPLEAWGQGYGWVSGEPNNYQKPCMNGDACYEHCGFMVSDQGDKWNDDLCESTKQYVCEWDSIPGATQ
jgi:hypothetical protein